MKRSRFLINTMKETPKEAVVISHVLMLRTCMIKQLTSGIYTYMPLALRSLRKVENIVREELDADGCQEMMMPMVQPAGLWIESGRWRDYGKELLRFKDRKENEYCLGPTHEEVITDIVRHEIRSYKDMPQNFYQIQTKFRDEIRPRFGLMRGREFLMKDAYSFDRDDEHADRSYWAMYEAYKRIFTRCGLVFRPVQADSGAIGGSFTHEFHVLAESGEDLILSCNGCDYAANVERADLTPIPAHEPGPTPEPVAVATPNRKTIEALASFLKVSPEHCIKTLLYRADDQLVAAVIPGDRELNETALKNAMDCVALEMVTDRESFEKHGLHPGYLGPVNWPSEEIPLYVDDAVMALAAGVAGANEPDVHLTGVTPVLHIRPTKVLSLRLARAGDPCPNADCDGVYQAHRGIEVGHVFKLGCKYSEAMKATFLDAEGAERPIVMGCYGIGVSRTMAAAIEQNHDQHGVIWPVQVAPFHVMLLNLDIQDTEVSDVAERIYQQLWSQGVEVLLDDTAQRPGPKFKDADLIGLPVQITVGARSLKQGLVELKTRKTGEKQSVPVEKVADEVIEMLKSLGWNPR